MNENTRTIIGIDYSMNSPGVCIAGGLHAGYPHTLFGFVNSYTGNPRYVEGAFEFNIRGNIEVYKHQIDRFDKLAKLVMFAISGCECIDPIVYIEGYSMGSKGQVFHIAENTAILKHYFHRTGIEVIEVAPTTLKKFATGKGNATKDLMYETFVRDTGIDLRTKLTPTRKLGSPVSDLVDAYWISELGRKLENEKTLLRRE
jgi:hypothetical protein